MLKSLSFGFFAVTVAAAASIAAYASEWFVDVSGKETNDGTPEGPWDLDSALSSRHNIHPGDTIWVNHGTYVAPEKTKGEPRSFICLLSGAKNTPIIVRSLACGRVTLQSSIYLMRHDVWLWGMELAVPPGQPVDVDRAKEAVPGGVFINSPTDRGGGCKLINCVVHHNILGVWTKASQPDSEVYGCIIYDIGKTEEDLKRGRGHGIYAQNDEGVQHIVDNIVWDNYDIGIHCYAQGQDKANNFEVRGNFLFANGAPVTPDGCTNLLVGAQQPSKGIVVADNVSYMHPVSNRVNTKLYFSEGVNDDLTCTGNIFLHGRYALNVGCWRKLIVTGNRFFARSQVAVMPIDSLKPGEKGDYFWDKNEYTLGSWPSPFEVGWGQFEQLLDVKTWQVMTGFDANSIFQEGLPYYPKGVETIVRPNKYQPGRAHIAVLNWDRRPEVKVSLRGVLKPGQPYRIFNVQKLWDAPVASGTYDGKEISLPSLLTWLAPEFDAYLVIPSADGEGR